MSLTTYEQETHISYNRQDDRATIYTADPKMITKLNKLIAASDDIKLERSDAHGNTYSLPKPWVVIRRPRTMSDEERAAVAERLKAYQFTSQIGD